MKKLFLLFTLILISLSVIISCKTGPQTKVEENIEVNKAHTITFMASMTAFRESSMVYLDSVASFMKRNPETMVRLEGYPDRDQKIDTDFRITSMWLEKSQNHLFGRGVAVGRIDTRVNDFKRHGFLGDINIDILIYNP
jgi:hypothetical protein